jgi:hypothetical protein
MAKRKKRRVRRSSNTTAEASESSGGGRDYETMLRDEYDYVVKDLRIIFLVAALMFVLLIVLNLLL